MCRVAPIEQDVLAEPGQRIDLMIGLRLFGRKVAVGTAPTPERPRARAVHPSLVSGIPLRLKQSHKSSTLTARRS